MRRALVAGALIAVAWFLRQPLEASMLRHMLLQWPLLLAAGVLLTPPRQAPPSRWNGKGVPGLLLSSTALVVWMLPLMLDLSVDAVAIDLAKFASLILAGALAHRSWQMAPMPVRLFFAGNTIWMTASIGVMLQSARGQLCTSYLQQDQVWTGIGLVVVAVGVTLVGGVPLLRRMGVFDATEGRESRARVPVVESSI